LLEIPFLKQKISELLQHIHECKCHFAIFMVLAKLARLACQLLNTLLKCFSLAIRMRASSV
jgi:hypothetical protein